MSTIVVHGTLARDETWWRAGGDDTFLIALAEGMAIGGREPHDIWTIAGRPVGKFDTLHPEDRWGFFGTKRAPFDQVDGHFRWSGANVHTERVDHGKALARYLEALSSINPAEAIDIVAHSHGANLVKVATNNIHARVPLGRLVFLAAPHCDKAQVSWTRVDYPYRLHPSWPSRGVGAARPVLNVYSQADAVQTTVSSLAPDTFGAPPGIPGRTPVFTAYRVDPDPRATGAYEDLEIPASAGGPIAEHSALHNPAIGRSVGLWLARWPELTGAECYSHVAG